MKTLWLSLVTVALLAATGQPIRAQPAARPPFKVSIQGQVAKPGRYAVSPDFSVLDAIEMAGGFTASALRSDVQITRVAGNGSAAKKTVYRLDYSDFQLNNGNAEFRLQPGDVIFIPADPTYGK